MHRIKPGYVLYPLLILVGFALLMASVLVRVNNTGDLTVTEALLKHGFLTVALLGVMIWGAVTYSLKLKDWIAVFGISIGYLLVRAAVVLNDLEHNANVLGIMVLPMVVLGFILLLWRAPKRKIKERTFPPPGPWEPQ